MWVNFQRSQSGENTNRPPTVKPSKHNTNIPSKQQSSHTPAQTRLSRQNSTRSQKSSTSNLQKKIDEFSFKSNTEEWKKQQEYNERRLKRKLMKKQLKSERKLKQVRRLHVPAAMFILFGIVLTFGACLRSVSEGTFMWENRETFRIVGPAVLGTGILILMTAVALDGYIKEKYKIDDKPLVLPFLHPDFQLEKQPISRQASSATTCDLDDSYCPLIKGEDGRSRSKWYQFAHFNTTLRRDDSMWNSSGSSNTTSHDSQPGTRKWRNGASFSISEESDIPFSEQLDHNNQLRQHRNNSETVDYIRQTFHGSAGYAYEETSPINCGLQIVLGDDLVPRPGGKCDCLVPRPGGNCECSVPRSGGNCKFLVPRSGGNCESTVPRPGGNCECSVPCSGGNCKFLVPRSGGNCESTVPRSGENSMYIVTPSDDAIEQQYLDRCISEDTTGL